ncbi:MAG: fatty acyl-AMP ligase [Nocardiaceae bacterium]|nr:fatty acyl-AMP ligase [Nocardiaceae bacterium]
MTSELITHLRTQFTAALDSRSFTFLSESGRGLAADVGTFAEIDRAARELAVWLSQHADRRQPVLLLFEPSLDFWKTFLGCVLAGVTAIPAPLPHDQRSMQRVAKIHADAGARLTLTSVKLRDILAERIDKLELTDAMDVVAVGAATASDPDDWTPPDVTNDAVAFLQYTSGSTGDPKGVAVTHANVMANQSAMAEAMGAGPDSVVVGWVPHFHDMGLLGGLLGFHIGGNTVSMAPMAFLKQPVRLLKAISDYRGTISAAPNFAFDLIAKRTTPEQIADLDLSCWEVAINGAEPVRQRTIERLAEALAPAGFSPATMKPAFGMAEVTLMATMTRETPKFVVADLTALEQHRFESAAHGVSLVSSGPPAPGVEVRIVDPQSLAVLPEDAVGEIWLRGASVASGYYNRPVETAERFDARTADGDGPYLRTGDLGLLHEGELYVTGRLKDVLIMNGRNLYPQDIEALIQDVHPAIEGSRGVALSIDAKDGERLVVVQAIKPRLLGEASLDDLAKQMKSAIARGFDVAAPSVVLVGQTGIHLTTSGKVQRSSMRKAFRDGDLSSVLHHSIDPVLLEFLTVSAGPDL